MPDLFKKIKAFAVAHKVWSGIIILAVVFTGYKIFHPNASAQTRYVLSAVSKGTIITTVDGSGQVSASNQIDLTAKASGAITYVGAVAGQQVKAGSLIAEIDSRDAQIALQNARIALAKLTTPDSLSLLQGNDTLAKANQSLTDAYASGFNTVSKTLLDMPAVLDGLNALYNSGYLSSKNTSSGIIGKKGNEYITSLSTSYYDSKNSFDAVKSFYATISSPTDTADAKTLIQKAQATVQMIAQAIKDAQTAVDYVSNYIDNGNSLNASQSASARTDLTAWTNTVSGYVSDLASASSSIDSAENTIAETNGSLSKLKNPDPLDLESAQLAVQQQQNNYENYFIRAPFDGVVATMNVKVGDSASGTIATLISPQELAQISLNEVDVAKIALNDKATLTFDAIPDLTIAGVVSQIDQIGTVSQGVVTYNVKINFDTSDSRVKPGMSVSASIITDVKQDVLTVPNSAIKSSGNQSYVQVLDAPDPEVAGTTGVTSKIAPRQVPVQTGLSNDTDTEIVSGLNEGDKIISRTITATAATATTSSAPSLFGTGGGNRGGGGGGAVRIGGGTGR